MIVETTEGVFSSRGFLGDAGTFNAGRLLGGARVVGRGFGEVGEPIEVRRVSASFAFIALIALLFFLGFGYYFENEVLRTIAGVLALISAIPIVYLSYEEAAEEGPQPPSSTVEDAVERPVSSAPPRD